MLWSPTGNSKCDEENKVPTKFRKRRRGCQTKQIRDFFRLGGDDGAVSCCCCGSSPALLRGPPVDSSSLSEVFCPPAAPPHGPDTQECVGGAMETHRERIGNQYVRLANLTIGAFGSYTGDLTQLVNRNAVHVIPAVCDIENIKICHKFASGCRFQSKTITTIRPRLQLMKGRI